MREFIDVFVGIVLALVVAGTVSEWRSPKEPDGFYERHKRDDH